MRKNPPGSAFNIALVDPPKFDIVLRNPGSKFNISFAATVSMALAESGVIQAVLQASGEAALALDEAATVADAGVFVRTPFPPVVIATIEVGAGPFGFAEDLDSIWVTAYSESALTRISPAELAAVETVALPPGSGPVAAAFDGGALWITLAPSRRVVRINLDRAGPRQITASEPLPSYPKAILFDGTNLWIPTNANAPNGSVAITVNNPTPGGGDSDAVALTIVGADPSPLPS